MSETEDPLYVALDRLKLYAGGVRDERRRMRPLQRAYERMMAAPRPGLGIADPEGLGVCVELIDQARGTLEKYTELFKSWSEQFTTAAAERRLFCKTRKLSPAHVDAAEREARALRNEVFFEKAPGTTNVSGKALNSRQPSRSPAGHPAQGKILSERRPGLRGRHTTR